MLFSLMVGLPGEVDVPHQAHDGDDQRPHQERDEVEVDHLARWPNL